MNISHHLSTEKPDHMACNSDHEHHDLQGCSHSRSYTCAFCKRGFANAQALGGHMNIHRRDRAKLKQLASDHDNFLSLDSTNPIINPIHPPPPPTTDQASEEKAMFLLESSEEGSGTPPKLPRSSSIIGDDCDSSRNKDSQELIQQLPFFVDAKLDTKGNEDKKMQLSNDSPQEGLDVDLELRLGPEPHESLTRSRTRRFF